MTAVNIHTIDVLYNKGYRPKRFAATKRDAGPFDPVGVMLLEKNGDFFESVIFERFNAWLYATPEKLVREGDL